MSKRLANKVAKAVRRRERGFAPSLFPVGDFRPSSPYASTMVPDSEREMVTERLFGDHVLKTYMDTLEGSRRPRKALPPPETAPEPEVAVEGTVEVPEATPEEAKEPSRFADYSMPGFHPTKGIVFSAKV